MALSAAGVIATAACSRVVYHEQGWRIDIKHPYWQRDKLGTNRYRSLRRTFAVEYIRPGRAVHWEGRVCFDWSSPM